jgi:hypothetical protein
MQTSNRQHIIRWHYCDCMLCVAGLGFTATSAKFAEVIGVTWAGSQVTKVGAR